MRQQPHENPGQVEQHEDVAEGDERQADVQDVKDDAVNQDEKAAEAVDGSTHVKPLPRVEAVANHDLLQVERVGVSQADEDKSEHKAVH